MTDRELLERAAKVAGLSHLTEWSENIRDHDSPHCGTSALHAAGVGGECRSWNPLEDDGDALRLAVRLGLVMVCAMPEGQHDGCSSDIEEETPNAVKRRDIVRAAAVMATEAE
ncbi:hypothetical protein [Chromohalobacter canadensis]|uniref:hypothetical protein n=1 Tax=Chromohalobacter canadensis TaxID=141389 RepID=UPI00240F27C7|nr:hypothetical protein [Chromohalobacter canadensis]